MLVLEWPRRWDTTFTGTPAARASVAAVWQRPWNLMRRTFAVSMRGSNSRWAILFVCKASPVREHPKAATEEHFKTGHSSSWRKYRARGRNGQRFFHRLWKEVRGCGSCWKRERVFKVAVVNAKRFPRLCGRARARSRDEAKTVVELFHEAVSHVSFHSLQGSASTTSMCSPLLLTLLPLERRLF